MALVEHDDISVLHPSSLPKLLRNSRLLRCLSVLTVVMVRINVTHPQSGLKWVAISAEQDPDNPVATCKSVFKSFVGCPSGQAEVFTPAAADRRGGR
jgi:hypothetical protein